MENFYLINDADSAKIKTLLPDVKEDERERLISNLRDFAISFKKKDNEYVFDVFRNVEADRPKEPKEVNTNYALSSGKNTNIKGVVDEILSDSQFSSLSKEQKENLAKYLISNSAKNLGLPVTEVEADKKAAETEVENNAASIKKLTDYKAIQDKIPAAKATLHTLEISRLDTQQQKFESQKTDITTALSGATIDKNHIPDDVLSIQTIIKDYKKDGIDEKLLSDKQFGINSLYALNNFVNADENKDKPELKYLKELRDGLVEKVKAKLPDNGDKLLDDYLAGNGNHKDAKFRAISKTILEVSGQDDVVRSFAATNIAISGSSQVFANVKIDEAKVTESNKKIDEQIAFSKTIIEGYNKLANDAKSVLPAGVKLTSDAVASNLKVLEEKKSAATLVVENYTTALASATQIAENNKFDLKKLFETNDLIVINDDGTIKKGINKQEQNYLDAVKALEKVDLNDGISKDEAKLLGKYKKAEERLVKSSGEKDVASLGIEMDKIGISHTGSDSSVTTKSLDNLLAEYKQIADKDKNKSEVVASL